MKSSAYYRTSRAKVFKALVMWALAMGMIGTLVGLVQMLANMDYPKALACHGSLRS